MLNGVAYQGYSIFYTHPFCNRFLRTQFTLDDPDEVTGLRVLYKGGARAEIYLNGYRVAEVTPHPSLQCVLAPESVKLLRKGTNTVAVYVAGGNCNAGEIDLLGAGENRRAPRR